MKNLFYFDPSVFVLFIIGSASIVSSIISFEVFKKYKLSLCLLFIAGLFLCSFMALLDPFLNNWDEQFHALVAKNLLLHPLVPTLYENPILTYDANSWISNHIWLHKQPLFLWQIALSLKLFGMNEFVVRIPSIIMMSLLPIFIYRIGKISLSEKIGYYGAVLFCSAFYVHEMLTGFPPSDHNDISFLFYITASIWAWVEYESSKKKYWLLLIGLFSGGAVLIKWLTGLLVYAGWGLTIILDKKRRKILHEYRSIILSFIVATIVFIPWQIYISYAFPVESSYEYSLNSKHFFKVVEDHGGDAFFYFDNLRKTYGGGQLVPFLILFSLLFFYKNIITDTFKIAFFSFIIIVYLFFSLAATKMSGFCYIVSPFIFLSIASLIDNVLSYLKVKIFRKELLQNIFSVILIVLIAWGNLDLYKIAYKHTMLIRPDDNDKRIDKINDALFIKSIKNILPSEDYVIFNCKAQKNISIMFYTNNIAYDKPLNYNDYTYLKNKKTKLAIIDNGTLPDFIQKDQSIIKIKAPDSTW
ncbi:MAG: glycosyltransferase family 39 protein [Bacteroidetes bacterium]|nr:glycosyltransferase family 39 protein [Bacteroidota bacterium]